MLIVFVALSLLGFLAMEMFFCTHPFVAKRFGTTSEQASASAPLAAKMGLYNGFLAAGLAWGLFGGSGGLPVKVFFLCCVVIAGVHGGLTAKRSIVVVQAAPAALALSALRLAQP